MTPLSLVAVLALALLEGSLVALPRPDGLARLAHLRSPVWALALPGSILIGTFAPLWEHPVATALAVLAAAVTPLLAVLAAATVARGRRKPLITAVAFGVALVLAFGPNAELVASIVTALGCMAAGVALTRLIPPRWLLVGVAAMAGVDVLLLAVHVGQPAAALMADATARFHGRAFDAATVGPITLGYPDMVLAGVLGGFVAGRSYQRRAALALVVLAAASGMLLAVIDMVPSTPPVALTFVLVLIWQRTASPRKQRRSPPRPTTSPTPVLTPCY